MSATAGAAAGATIKKVAKRLALDKLFDAASKRGKKKDSDTAWIEKTAAIVFAFIMIITIIVNLPAVMFGFLGFASANSYNAVFAQQVVNDLTTEDVKAYFGTTEPSLEKDEMGNYVDPRAYIHEGISKQWYCAITGTDHLIWRGEDAQAVAVARGQAMDNLEQGIAEYASGSNGDNSTFGQIVNNVTNKVTNKTNGNNIVGAITKTTVSSIKSLLSSVDLEWSSADGLRDIFNDYKTYLENNVYVDTDTIDYTVIIENDFMSIFSDNMRWDRDNMETYTGVASTNYNRKEFWEKGLYANAVTEICQKYLTADELKEIENFEKDGNKEHFESICEEIGWAIVDLDTNKVFGKGAFTTTTPSQENGTLISTLSFGKFQQIDVKLSINNYRIPFNFYQYKNDCAKEVNYKLATDEDTLNLSISMLKNMDEGTFDKNKGEQDNGISLTSSSDDILSVIKDFTGGLVTFRGVSNVGSEDNTINPDFDLEAFDDWYKSNDGYTKGYAEFIDVKYAASGSGTTSGNTVQDLIYTTLRNKTECNHTTACGFMGNINNESGWNPASDDKPPNGPYGLCQWLNGGGSTRREQLENMAIINGKQPSDPAIQAEFIALDLNTGHKQDVDVCNSQYPNADDCAVYMMCKYYAAPSWPVERTMVAYTQSGRQIDTHSFHFVGAQNGAGNQNFKTEERIAEALKFDQIYQAYAFVPNGQVVISGGGVVDYVIAQIDKLYRQVNEPDGKTRMDEDAFDCSSLIARAFHSVGNDVFMSGNWAMDTHEEWKTCEANGWLFPCDDSYVPQAGDIWFFADSYSSASCGHVGMYVGDHGDFDFVHAKGHDYGVVKENDYLSRRRPMAVGRVPM